VYVSALFQSTLHRCTLTPFELKANKRKKEKLKPEESYPKPKFYLKITKYNNKEENITINVF
jgi:hypothetical protein